MRPLVAFTENAFTNGVQETEPLSIDFWCSGPISIQVAVYNAPGQAVKYTVQTTLDDPNSPSDPVPEAFVSWFNIGDVNLVASTVAAQTYLVGAPRYIRLVQTEGTGIAQLTVIQSGAICS